MNGGVIPHIAVYLHEESIEDVVSTALTKSNVKLQDLSAIAVTTKPGLRGSLKVGVKYAKHLASACGKPLIPIHHMEAHALTARLLENIEFPFLTLLASGGHCQIALVKSLQEFLLLGTSSHNSPGEVLDKIARRLKLQNLPECYEMSGGQAIEFMAKDGDPLAYSFPYSLTHHRDCNFSFSGFTSFATKTIEIEEEEYDVPPDGVVPTAKDICASLLHGYALHMMHRIHRAFIFCEIKNLLNSNKRSLVFSGGVACNTYIRTALNNMCAALNTEFYCPPSRLCTDNGIMIAWNGVEKLKAGVDICSNFESIKPDPDCPLGTDLSEEVRKASIKVKMPKIDLQVEKEKVSAT
ncbi:probable tRNA N6-adenosine threonylcarbamoyltransferase, mitochondrial isoform X2 [Stegodyphus dumicola]|uniref:probable tRNA N6-adenosine threonylcarbamoyltransferase, mitochondrial isoform X2 n=1 Tax=Stegodyphus dumicola TaxID=202533 RepID=UPI0015B1E435|nr:probable tRNA N6-adenosine threonylcarbamoyltransferase, mitochondrial isoform X2 [Stegodyphus dumicola]